MRYMRLSEQALARRNLYLSLLDAGDLATANAANIGSWEPLIPILDTRINPQAAADMICIGLFDGRGGLVAIGGARLFTITTSVKDEFESLRMFYGPSAQARAASEQFSVTAPSASQLRGRVSYGGGIWVRPDARGASLAGTFTRFLRFTSLAAFNPDLSLGLGTGNLLRRDVTPTYDFGSIEPGFTYTKDGSLVWEGVIVFTKFDTIFQQFEAELERLNKAEPLHQ